MPRLQTDITKMAAAATTMAVDDTELDESQDELDDEDLIRYKKICMFLQRKHGW